MNISVILCTYNRCESLGKALESLAASRLPAPVEWEVLVVDNNSSDRTREVVADCCTRYPGHFRYLLETKRGKSNALNAGIREAQGDILAFVDDDVAVEPKWLQNLTAPLNNGEWSGSGGRTFPDRDFSRPRWLSGKGRHALAPLGLFDLGPEACRLVESPYGNNMAFRKAMFEKYGGFRTDLGPRPGTLDPQKAEDSEFGSRLLAAGERLSYEPSAVIYHQVPDSRLQKKYFLDWWFDKGRADIRHLGIPHSGMCVCGVPLYLFRRFARWTLQWLVTINPSARFDSRLNVQITMGQIVECRRQTLATSTEKKECKA